MSVNEIERKRIAQAVELLGGGRIGMARLADRLGITPKAVKQWIDGDNGIKRSNLAQVRAIVREMSLFDKGFNPDTGVITASHFDLPPAVQFEKTAAYELTTETTPTPAEPAEKAIGEAIAIALANPAAMKLQFRGRVVVGIEFGELH